MMKVKLIINNNSKLNDNNYNDDNKIVTSNELNINFTNINIDSIVDNEILQRKRRRWKNFLGLFLKQIKKYQYDLKKCQNYIIKKNKFIKTWAQLHKKWTFKHDALLLEFALKYSILNIIIALTLHNYVIP